MNDSKSLAEAMAELARASETSMLQFSNALSEMSRVFTNTEWVALQAAERQMLDVHPRAILEGWEDGADERGCRLCGGTIELGCCTRCGVPEETR